MSPILFLWSEAALIRASLWNEDDSEPVNGAALELCRRWGLT